MFLLPQRQKHVMEENDREEMAVVNGGGKTGCTWPADGRD